MLTIHHLYADMMNLYGDRGNVISIKKRCEWRGIPVEVVDVGLGEKVKPTGCDLFLFGGGQDREQALLAEDLSGSKGADLRTMVEDGGVILGVCGGYQLMGHSYETPEGEKLPGVGIFDLHTEPRKPDEERLIGNVLVSVQAPEIGEAREIVGFENHGGRTNIGKDGTEGARRLNAYGTYLHGSLLPKNPWLTDQLILNVLRCTDESFELEPLDDTMEGRAFSAVASGESRVCSSRSGIISRILDVLIWPSMMTCETCIPCGPNSRAMDCASALKPNLPTASAENLALPRSAADAPVSRMVPCPASTIAGSTSRAA